MNLSHHQAVEAERYPPELTTAIYRMVQEALTNAGKHSKARRAWAEIEEAGQSVLVTVRDDGQGFDPRPA